MTSMHVLLVDDEERFLSTTKALLEKRGIKTSVAPDGMEALKIIEELRLDVVVLDVKMPGLDGVEVLRRIREHHPLLEVVMLTGHATVESAVEGLKLGAFDYVTKPCDIDELIEKVNEACAKKRAMEQKIRESKVEEIIKHPLAVFDKEEEEEEEDEA